MIVRIKLETKSGQTLIMLFGDSYKRWDMQFREFCKIKNVVAILSVETCKDSWIGYGGLKWCSHDEFQDELNNEAKGKNIKPRIYEKMQFVENKSFKTKAKKCIN